MVQHPLVPARGVLLLVSLLFLVAGSSAVSQVRPLALEEMVRSAGFIIVGTVAATQSGLDDDGEIVTWTVIHVEQSLLPLPTNVIVIKQLGGVAGGLEHRLSHMRYFSTGERVVAMFYPPSSLGFTSAVGLNQAVWSIDAGGMVAGLSDVAVADLGPLAARFGVRDVETQSLELGRFLDLLRELVARRGAR